jgi:hypothetical protein
MTNKHCLFVVSMTFAGLLHGNVINTNHAPDVSAFQTGATIEDFESISGRTP